MRLFLDSCHETDIQKALDSGFLAGITTNPHILAQSPELTLEEIIRIAKQTALPFNLQVCSNEALEMVEQGKKFASFAQNIVVKVPLTDAGLKACQALRKQGIQVNVTLCFSIAGALLAAQAGANYVSPFIGRLEASGEDALSLIENIRILYDMHGFETEIIAASIRTRQHAEEAALRGAEIATCPANVFFDLVNHPLTRQGLDNITPHYDALKKKLLSD